MDNSNRPDLRAYIGATGTGKGVSIRDHLRASKPTRLAIWDPLREYGEFGRFTDSIPELCLQLGKKAFRVCYWPGSNVADFPARFDHFCRAVFAAGDCTVHVEELADVTSASHAPAAWRRITKQGRHRGLRVIAATQRPADCDKSFLSGLTYARAFAVRWPRDRRVLAECMDEPGTEIAALATREIEGGATSITYLEKDFRTGKRDRKTIVLRPKKHSAT